MNRESITCVIRNGVARDYLALAHHHYHPDPPATIVSVLVASEPRSMHAMGVLVVSMPVLNATWREAVFPGRYRTGDRRADAQRLNAEIRTISRVVVDPRYRGLGVGTSLVRHYLRRPLTPITEALAVMGAFSRFFEAAGMRSRPHARAPRDLRLIDALAALNIAPWLLAAPELLPRTLLESPFLHRELRRWAQGSCATRRFANNQCPDLLRRAAGIFHPPAAFVAVSSSRRAA